MPKHTPWVVKVVLVALVVVRVDAATLRRWAPTLIAFVAGLLLRP